MTRIAIIDRADMDAEQARVFDAAKNSGGVTGGPFYAYIRMPKLFEAAQNLRTALWEGPLSGRERQIVTMTVARHWNAEYPWAAQARGARAVGVEQAVIDAINARKTPNLPDERERTCFEVAQELLTKRGLSQETYERAEKALGLNDLIALVAATGNFSTTCLVANTFEVDAPADNPTPLMA